LFRRAGRRAAVEILLGAGTDPTTRNHQGLTPLDVARRTSS
jgi:ankyrin repeat protein